MIFSCLKHSQATTGGNFANSLKKILETTQDRQNKEPSYSPPGDCCCRVQRCILWPCLVSARQACTVTSILFPSDLAGTMTQPNKQQTAYKSNEKSNQRCVFRSNVGSVVAYGKCVGHRIERPWFERRPRSLCCVLGRLSQCLS